MDHRQHPPEKDGAIRSEPTMAQGILVVFLVTPYRGWPRPLHLSTPLVPTLCVGTCLGMLLRSLGAEVWRRAPLLRSNAEHWNEETLYEILKGTTRVLKNDYVTEESPKEGV